MSGYMIRLYTTVSSVALILAFQNCDKGFSQSSQSPSTYRSALADVPSSTTPSSPTETPIPTATPTPISSPSPTLQPPTPSATINPEPGPSPTRSATPSALRNLRLLSDIPTIDELLTKNKYGAGNRHLEWDLLNKSFARTFAVETREQFLAAMTQSRPGDAILIGEGRYDWGEIVWPKDINGTKDNPIYVIPRRIGYGAFVRSTQFAIHGSHIQFSGLYFLDTNHPEDPITIRVRGGANVQIKYNLFESIGKTTFSENKETIVSAIHIDGGSMDTEVSFNVFTDIHGLSVGVGQPNVQWRKDTDYMAEYPTPKRIWIHHNTFSKIPFIRENGGEAIMLGYGWDNRVEGFDDYINGVISHNLFDQANGDGEIISIKASGNHVYHNYVVNSGDCRINIREGDDNIVAHNVIHGQTIGFGVTGSRNYFIYNILDIGKGGIGFYLHHTDYNEEHNAMNYWPAKQNYFARNIFISEVAAAFYSLDIVPYGEFKGPLQGNFIFENVFLHRPLTFYLEQRSAWLDEQEFFATNSIYRNYVGTKANGTLDLSELKPRFESPTFTAPPEVLQQIESLNHQNFDFQIK